MGRGDCIKVVVSPEISIYNDSIDHRFPLKQYLDVAHLRGEGRQAGRVGDEERRMRYKIRVTERGIQAQKKQKEKCTCARESGIGRGHKNKSPSVTGDSD